jgi:hypothetical protein
VRRIARGIIRVGSWTSWVRVVTALNPRKEYAATGTVRERLRACIASGVPYPGDGAGTSQLLYQLMPVVIRSSQGAALHTKLFERQAGRYESVLDAGRGAGRQR